MNYLNKQKLKKKLWERIFLELNEARMSWIFEDQTRDLLRILYQ